ncbi:hypothetical protein [Microbacterium sp. NPDC089695]|uniref:hypothetical protein n=1 Tax=Microbacterium sp. NPDC089695 TaxID=3364198 RepID=UPI0038146CE4
MGTSLILGMMMRTLWVTNRVRAVGLWLLPLLVMGALGAFVTSYRPIADPLWLHYVLIVGCPFAVGFVGLALLIGRGSADERERTE